MVKVKCQRCTKSFSAKRANARFCSDQCREGAKPRGQKTPPPSQSKDKSVQSWDASQDRIRVLTKPNITTQTEWTLDQIKSAINNHEKGYFDRSGKLWQYLNRDDRLQAVLNVHVSALPALPLTISSANREPKPEEITIATWLDDKIFDMLPEKTLRQLHRSSAGMGFALAQIEWKVDPELGYWIPYLNPWPAENVRYDDTCQKWKVQTREGVEVDVTLGDGKWFLWLPDGDRSFQAGNILALAFLCFITLNDWTDWIEANDAFGHPTRKATVPRAATPASKDLFFENLQALDRYVNTILCEKNTDGSGFDFEYVVADMKGVDSIERSLEQANKGKAILLNGQSLTTDVVATGALSLGRVHQEIKAQVIASVANSFATDYRSQVLKPMAYYNHGSANLAPWVEWDTRPPIDQKTRAESHVSTAAAVKALEEILNKTPKELDILAYLEPLELALKDRLSAPVVTTGIDLVKSEGLLAALKEVLKGSGKQLNIDRIMAQLGVLIKDGEVIDPDAIPQPAPGPSVPTPPAAFSGLQTRGRLISWKQRRI
jgi:phage gp29-like protein